MGKRHNELFLIKNLFSQFSQFCNLLLGLQELVLEHDLGTNHGGRD